MKNYLLFFLLFSYSFHLFSQQDAWVYLKDKGTGYSTSTPSDFLTQKAIERKVRHGVTIDVRDIPVNESYITQLKNATGITVMAKSKWFNAIHVRGSQANISNLLSSYSFVQSIDFADKSLNSSKIAKQKTETKLESVSTDFVYGTTENQVSMINADDLHLAGYTGTGMTVAVMDAGYPGVNTIGGFQRLRNVNGILGTYDFVNRDEDVYTNTTSNHGTLVLSTMAGYIENQFVGTAPDAFYYLFITEDGPKENPVEESYWVEAAERADSLGVDVINTSLGYTTFDNSNYNYSQDDMNGQTAFISKGANMAFQKGLLLVNSAGNEGDKPWGIVSAPADAEGVFTVGAVNAAGTYAAFSSLGNSTQITLKPDVVAQGAGSAVITENNALATASGTSFSSPILAGGLTCLWQALPHKTNAEIMQMVRESASQYNAPDYQYGYGIPDLFASLNLALILDEDSLKAIKLYPNPVKDKLYLQLPVVNQPYNISLYDALGKRIFQRVLFSSENEIDVSQLAKGLYVMKIGGEKNVTFKLIKQ